MDRAARCVPERGGGTAAEIKGTRTKGKISTYCLGFRGVARSSCPCPCPVAASSSIGNNQIFILPCPALSSSLITGAAATRLFWRVKGHFPMLRLLYTCCALKSSRNPAPQGK
ncbi:hypothetical protein SUGI_0254100 [Cryptomeria japonica]|nr:hypothetical protein SUGI_0254100 [Cryptomeria japonica]